MSAAAGGGEPQKPAAVAVPPGRESFFERIADWVSAAMGRPTNILVWLVLVAGWTSLFALGVVGPAGSFLPAWFTGTGYNFPLNLVTTVAELFIGFLVAAAANRSERNLHRTLAAIAAQEGKISAQEEQIASVEDTLREQIEANTALTRQVHDLVLEIHGLTAAAAVAAPGAGAATAPTGDPDRA